MLKIKIFLSCLAQSVNIFINFFEYLKYYFRNNKIIRICNSINIDMLNYFAVRTLDYINCFDLFQIKVIIIRSKLVHHVKVLVFKYWIVTFDKHDKIKKFRWFLIYNNEWREKFSKFLLRSRQISFEKRIFILLSHKRFF